MSGESAAAGGRGPQEIERLIAVLGDESAHFQERERAAYKLGLSREPQAFEPLRALVDYTDPAGEDVELEYFSVRFAVVLALADLQDARALDELVRLLGDDDLDIVKAAAEALAKLGDERAIEPLREVAGWYDADYAYVAAAHAIDVIRRGVRRRKAMLEAWEPGTCGKGILILKKGELDSELELWKTKNGSPTIFEGMQILESVDALRDISAPIAIWPDGRFLLYYVPWAAAEDRVHWGGHIQRLDERLRFDREGSLGREFDFSGGEFPDQA